MKKFLKLLCLIFFMVFFSNLYAQKDYASLEKVKYKNQKLTFIFKNCSDTTMYAPVMKLRRGIDSPYLYKEYWNIEENTLTVKLSDKVSSDLFVVRDGGESSATVLYIDKLLKPNKRFKTSIPFILPDHIKKIKAGGFILPICR